MTTKTPAAGENGDFSKLLTEVADLAKSMPAAETAADDAAIATAAEDGAAGDDKKKPAAAADKDKDGDVTKSYTIKLESGEEVTAIDGTELLKSLTERLDTVEKSSAAIIGQLFDVVKSQQVQIAKLAGAGKGRKAVVSVAEKPADKAAGDDINKSQHSDGMKPDEFLMKAEGMYKAGKLSAHQVQVAETCINTGRTIPGDIIRAVMAS